MCGHCAHVCPLCGLQVVIFNRGLIEQQGTPAEIIARPRTPFIMKFVGDTNVVPSTCMFVLKMKYRVSACTASVLLRDLTPTHPCASHPPHAQRPRPNAPQRPLPTLPAPTLTCPTCPRPPCNPIAQTPKSKVMFRPNDVALLREEPQPGEPQKELCPADVTDRANLGWSIKYTLRFDDDIYMDWQVRLGGLPSLLP